MMLFVYFCINKEFLIFDGKKKFNILVNIYVYLYVFMFILLRVYNFVLLVILFMK